ncbi:hypothetical protein KY290_010046 [Solanum tuberosum]|uniref:Uncharacterized protein n=1 Tax=Solanum tuberosum TaxID=4113 RepID=A0ABQ7VWP2_SOLTU|nr:hypothetical protein KY289_010426 [Solanum tuberosum]KAH0708572.1 hypothetical protein KY284_009999 [Solanum tuberosum]KAH0772909.1 hypothetical protein KY290_010046 [Solanum tuberosum]
MDSITSIISTTSSKNGIVADFTSMEEGKHGTVQSPFLSAFQKIIAELLGTYIFIFVGCGSALVDRERTLTIVGIALAWGLSLMALIYTLGHVSGAHFNPAVTIAFAAARKLPLMQYKSPVTDFEAIFWEFLMTLILMFVICGAATDDRATKEVAGVAIGVTLVFEVLIAGPITGASMNPARSLGPAIVSGVYKNQWVFVIAPILGAMTATGIYSLLRQPKQNTKI